MLKGPKENGSNGGNGGDKPVPSLSYYLRRDAGTLNGGSSSATTEAESPPPRPPSYYASQAQHQQQQHHHQNNHSSSATAAAAAATPSSYSYKTDATESSSSASLSHNISGGMDHHQLSSNRSPTALRKGGMIGGVNVSIFETTEPPNVEAKTIFKDFKYYGGNLTTSTYTPAIISPSSASPVGGGNSISSSSIGSMALSTSPSKVASKYSTTTNYATLPKSSATSTTGHHSVLGGSNHASNHTDYLPFSAYSSAQATTATAASTAMTTTHNVSVKEEPSYRVPYSSTNPFLPTFNPTTTTTSLSSGEATTTNSTTKPKGYHFN